MGDPERAIRVLAELKSLGVGLSIDDFGTGHSSLSYLLRFPLDVLKIDRTFVTNLVKNKESRQIVKTIMGLAKDMGMSVVAEGIETQGQALQLNLMGCDFGQGYLFSRPLPAADIVELMHAGQIRLTAPDSRPAITG
jgi:EAL domain-containing protein (putative c-di-GMP-specific phosphodiesterase class I)